MVSLGALSAAGPVQAAPSNGASKAVGAFDGEQARVELELLASHSAVVPGQEILAGVQFILDDDWHVYWLNPGDAGVASKIEVSAIGGSAGAIVWPAPSVYVQPGEIVTHGYSSEVMATFGLKVDAKAKGAVELLAEVAFLACNVECVPGKATLALSLPVTDALSLPITEKANLSESAERLSKIQNQRPRGAASHGVEVRMTFSAAEQGARFDLLLSGCTEALPEPPCPPWRVDKIRPLLLFPEQGLELQDLKVQDLKVQDLKVQVLSGPARSARLGPGLRVTGTLLASTGTFPTSIKALLLAKQGGRDFPLLIEQPLLVQAEGPALAGRGQANAQPQSQNQVRNEAQNEARNQALSSKVASAGNTASLRTPALNTARLEIPGAEKKRANDGEEKLGLGYALLLALLGGLILNLMPCVFPMLAIKVFSFMEMVHESRSARLAHAGAYTAGIVGSMLVLAAVVLGLKAFGTQVGWGFQFQSSGFLVLMCGVLVVFALSFFDVFVVGLIGGSLEGSVNHSDGLRRSVGEGVLAVALSTPCSAPLLGTAVGFALAAGGLTVVLVFVAIGLGLALPFVLLTQAPGLAKLMPKPGNWMVHARFVLGFSLLFAVVWMLWILGRVVGVDGLTVVLIYLLTLAMAGWIYGAMQKVGVRAGRLVLAPLAVAAMAGGYLIVPDPAPASGTATADASGPIAWRAWSPELVQATLQEGKPVFVDFTADWCITCKANEKAIINQAVVVKRMHDRGIVPFKADWTRPDERIRKALEANGKAGVPMYLVYNPKHPDIPQVLPEILTSGLLLDAFDAAAR